MQHDIEERGRLCRQLKVAGRLRWKDQDIRNIYGKPEGLHSTWHRVGEAGGGTGLLRWSGTESGKMCPGSRQPCPVQSLCSAWEQL